MNYGYYMDLAIQRVMLVLLLQAMFHFHVLFAITSLGEEIQKSDIYVFGDSTFESGPKSSEHDSWMKAGYFPYGSSCWDLGESRFTDGKTIPELIVESLKFKGQASIDYLRTAFEGGTNFASASAGILPETGKALGKNLCFREQIGNFKEYVTKNLKGGYQTEEELSRYLSRSIFLINIGASDYIHNYLQPNYYNTSKRYTGEEFTELLIKQYGDHLKELHKLGARKLVIFQVGPLGCLPYMVEKLKPRSRCAENINNLVSKFNTKLDAKLKDLGNELQGSQFVTARVFYLIKNMIEKPADYGFEETRWPCCPIQKNGTGICSMSVGHVATPSEWKKLEPLMAVSAWAFHNAVFCDYTPMPESLRKIDKWTGPNEDYACLYRRLYLFFDALHLTQAANMIIAEQLLAGMGSTCSPFGIKQLAAT